MAQLFTLGGDRLGSGSKQKVALHNFEMNSFNLEQDWKSSMAPGILYPFIKMVGTNHGTFDIDLDTFVRTLPTRGPLFGSFKLQLDLFSVPFRLYQGVLHNNPIDIGLNMNQVYLPKLTYKTVDYKGAPRVAGSNDYNYQVNESSLLKYLGISGAGRKSNRTTAGAITRKFNAVPMLAYYDIFKCYYSNKQEENAYVVTPGTPEYKGSIPNKITIRNIEGNLDTFNWNSQQQDTFRRIYTDIWNGFGYFAIEGKNLDLNKIYIHQEKYTLQYLKETDPKGTVRVSNLTINENKTKIEGVLNLYEIYQFIYGEEIPEEQDFEITANTESIYYQASIELTPFKLKNIDKMRYALLKENELGTEFILGSEGQWDEESGEDQTGLPYSALFKTTEEGISYNAFAQNGLMVKTYQSDLFNNWLDTEYIDGPNGISAITAVDTTSGSFTMDTLNLAEKFYELLNRIITAGGTYQDWQEAVYGEGAVRMCETPMYIGGMAAEIMFEEVIATTDNDEADQALGSLGGKGTQVNKKGGNNIHVKMDEPGYIMGIVSITPRICYSQGNDWDMTELDTLDDLHKPSLDGIGFQNLMVEQFAWWDTKFIEQQGMRMERNSAGKQTAWINYQTAVDKCYGDFAKQDGYSFMVLNRNYEMDVNDTSDVATVKDITTYIDPAKYNYAFSYADLSAQNFWVQIHSKVVARRKMGAQQLPNL